MCIDVSLMWRVGSYDPRDTGVHWQMDLTEGWPGAYPPRCRAFSASALWTFGIRRFSAAWGCLLYSSIMGLKYYPRKEEKGSWDSGSKQMLLIWEIQRAPSLRPWKQSWWEDWKERTAEKHSLICRMCKDYRGCGVQLSRVIAHAAVGLTVMDMHVSCPCSCKHTWAFTKCPFSRTISSLSVPCLGWVDVRAAPLRKSLTRYCPVMVRRSAAPLASAH